MKMTLYLWFTYVWHSGKGSGSGLSASWPLASASQ